MDYEIKHTGKVTGVSADSRSAIVVITDSAGADCSGCAARSLCHPTGKSPEQTEIAVATDNFALAPGMTVEIGLPASGRYRAITTALGIPSALLIGAAVGFPLLGMSQEISAVCAVAAVGLYYGALFLMRGRIQSRYRWRVTGVITG